MTNILFSGINKINGFNEEQTNCLNKYIFKNKTIVFIACDFNNVELAESKFQNLIHNFSCINIFFKNKFVIDSRVSKEEALEILKKSNYVFLMGGNPELQMKSIVEYGLVDSIKSKELIIGVSAGSMNQAKIVTYKDDFENGKLKKYSGLGAVDINIFPHVILQNEKIMSEVQEISNICPIVLLPDESFVVLDNQNVKYYGNYYLMKNGIIVDNN